MKFFYSPLPIVIFFVVYKMLVYAFDNSKPTTQRVLLNLAFHSLMATTLLFTLLLIALLVSVFVAFTH